MVLRFRRRAIEKQLGEAVRENGSSVKVTPEESRNNGFNFIL